MLCLAYSVLPVSAILTLCVCSNLVIDHGCIPVQGYKKLLQLYYALARQSAAESSACPLHVTLLLVMPPIVNLAALDVLDRTEVIGHELGIGYARLVIQLTAYTLNLQHVWLMDDNVQDCYMLPYQALLQNGRHDALESISFGHVMTVVQDQVSHCTGQVPFGV